MPIASIQQHVILRAQSAIFISSWPGQPLLFTIPGSICPFLQAGLRSLVRRYELMIEVHAYLNAEANKLSKAWLAKYGSGIKKLTEEYRQIAEMSIVDPHGLSLADTLPKLQRLNYLTPAEFARRADGGKDADSVHLKNDTTVFHFPTATTAAG